jgi:hypothetical protein
MRNVLELTARLLAFRAKLEECAVEAAALDQDSGGDRIMVCFQAVLCSLVAQLYALNPEVVEGMAHFHCLLAQGEHARLAENQDALQAAEVARVN